MSSDASRGPPAGSSPAAAAPSAGAGWITATTVAVVALSAGLRLAAARGDLFLDEIWSLRLAERAGSWVGVFTRLHHDNNHHLNTLWAMAVGGLAPPIAYRLASVAAATTLVVVLARWPLRPGAGASAATAFLAGVSYVLVQYGSEARGYALAALLAVAAWLALERWLATGRRRWAAAFAACASLGLLAHLTSLFVLAGAAFRSAAPLLRRLRERRLDAPGAALLAVPVVVVLGALWWVDLRHVRIGGGPPYELRAVLRELGRAILGLPRGPLELLALPFVALAGWELLALARARDGRAAFLGFVLVAPPLAVALWHPRFVALRYFVVTVPFFLALLGGGIARLADRGRAGAALAAAALALFAAGNAVRISRLVDRGRGDYRDPVARMVASTPGRYVTVGGDHDFRIRLVVDEQARRLGVRDRVVYVENARWSPTVPEWLLLEDFAEDPRPRRSLRVQGGREYALVAVYPYAGLSGWSGLLYRAVDR